MNCVCLWVVCVSLCPFSKPLCVEISHSLPCLDLEPVLTMSVQCLCGTIRTGEDNIACFSVFLLWIMIKTGFGCNFRRPCDYLCVLIIFVFVFVSDLSRLYFIFSSGYKFCSHCLWCIIITFDPQSEAAAAAELVLFSPCESFTER